MIMDERNEFADAASVAAAAGTALIGDQIPLSFARDVGNGQPVYLVITCSTSIVTASLAGTVKFQLVSDATAAIAVDGSATVHYDTGTFATGATASGALVAGETIAVVALPLEGVAYEGFLGVLAVTGTTATTAGAINAFLTLDPAGWQAYPEGAN